MQTPSRDTAPIVHPHTPFPLPAHHVFGGFWIRFAAYIIDQVCMALPFVLLLGIGVLLFAVLGDNDAALSALGIGFLLVIVLALFWSFAYYILFNGTKSTTPGKMLFGMRIVREDNGGKVSWGQAFGRTLGHVLSRMTLYIGFILAGFDAEKRALHDYLAKTRVIRDTTKSTTAGWVVFGIIMALSAAGMGLFMAMMPTSIQTEYDGWEDEYYDDGTAASDITVQ